jgi:hypothetical protein
MLTNLIAVLFGMPPAPAIKPVAAPTPTQQPFKVVTAFTYASPSLYCPIEPDTDREWAFPPAGAVD